MSKDSKPVPITMPRSRTSFELLCEFAAAAPDHPVAVTADESVSYADLARRASVLGARLQADGVRRGGRVGLLAGNCFEWLEVFFAVGAIGAVVIPISTWSTDAELSYLLKDSQLTHLFVADQVHGRQFAQAVAGLVSNQSNLSLTRVVVIAPGADDSGAGSGDGFHDYSTYLNASNAGADVADTSAKSIPEQSAGPVARPSDQIAVLYTSGSSSRPKAVALVHRDLIENGFHIGERQGLRADDKVLVSIPLFWSYGASNALPAILSHGATMVLQDRFGADGAIDLIEQYQCTAIYTLPAMTNALLASDVFKPARCTSLRTGVTIGAPQDILTAANELGVSQICNIYGSTETYGNCCVTPHEWSLEARSQCQGPPLPGVSLRIRHPETGQPCASGEVGQIEVSGYLTPGYTGSSDVHNAEVFTVDGYFRSGDLGSLNAQGALQYAGRSSEMIKRAGINVSPAEVEDILQQHGQVGLAAVTGVADPTRDEIIVAYVIPARRSDNTGDRDVGTDGTTGIDITDLLAHCRRLLSAYKVPDRVFVCDALPLTATGKLLRRELKTQAIRDVSKTPVSS